MRQKLTIKDRSMVFSKFLGLFVYRVIQMLVVDGDEMQG